MLTPRRPEVHDIVCMCRLVAQKREHRRWRMLGRRDRAGARATCQQPERASLLYHYKRRVYPEVSEWVSHIELRLLL